MLKITELRQELKLKQAELANQLNISVKKLGAWEQQRAEPSIGDIIKLADFFKVSTDYLLGRENDYGFVEIKGIELLQSQKVMLKVFDELNASGQLKAVAYAEGLKENPEFRK